MLYGSYIVIALLLAFALTSSGIFKLQKHPRIVEGMHGKLGVPMSWFAWLAAAEIAGALGLLIGILWAPLGIAAAIGVVLYFLGAIVTHLRVRDLAGIATPLIILLIAVAALGSRVGTL